MFISMFFWSHTYEFRLWLLFLIQGSESSFEWSDGSAFDYIPWKDKKSAGNCVVLDPKGIWKHESCNSVKDGAICYKPTECKTWFQVAVYLLKHDICFMYLIKYAK